MTPPLIALEEHFEVPSSASNEDNAPQQDPLHAALPPHLKSRLHDLSTTRLKEMAAGGTHVQVLSHIASVVSPSLARCQSINDTLACACAAAPPGKLKGFAMLPMHDPSAACVELERAITQLGFVGALVNNHLDDGSMYDDEKFWVVFETAARLDVPVYIHPTFPGDNLSTQYSGNFPPLSAVMMATSSWGWHSQTGLHILRLFAAGLFDKYPTLKIVIGHMGEMIPYMLDRIIHTTRTWGEFQRPLSTVWQENIWVTTSGLFSLPPLECLLKVSPKEKVMYSIDYPFSTNEMGLQFVRDIEKSGLLTAEEFEGFCHGNAERLLNFAL